MKQPPLMNAQKRIHPEFKSGTIHLGLAGHFQSIQPQHNKE